MADKKTRRTSSKLRRQIVCEAARLMYLRQETEYYRAKMKAARRICRGSVKPSDLPGNAEIRQEIQRVATLYEGDSRFKKLKEMRLESLRFMRMFQSFKPKLIGSTLTGHVRRGSDIDLHLFPNNLESVTSILDFEGIVYDVEHKHVKKFGEERLFTHVHIKERFPVELTIYSPDRSSYVFKSSITGKAMERATIAELEKLLQEEYPDILLDEEMIKCEESLDRFQVYESLLLPLGQIKQSRKYHPEGDVLYHSLQVYCLAVDELPYDEDFQLAALLHDIGKGIDPGDHVIAGLNAIEGFVSDRTFWLIQHHMDAHLVRDKTIGARARRRLVQSEYFEDLMLLQECDSSGREEGVDVPEPEEALDDIRELARLYG